MFVCEKVRNVRVMMERSVNLRFITSTARTVTQPSHNTSKTQKKKAHVSNTNKRERKLLKERLSMASEGTSKNHVYMNLYPWKTPQQLAEHLKSAEVYNNDGLIAINKPYGVAMAKFVNSTSGKAKTVIQTLNSSYSPDYLPAMDQVLPLLQKHYAADHLEIIKSTERWSSGLMLLSTSSEVTEKVQKCFRRSKTKSQPAMTYTAVTVGLSKPVNADTKVAITLEHVPSIGKVPVILKKYSNNSVKSGEAKPVVVKHKCITYNKEADVSLFEIKTQVMKWHFLRVWSAHSYNPILGDHMFASRVKTLVGRRVLLSPHNVRFEPQQLPGHLYSRLSLPAKSPEVIPCHIHLSNMILSQFNTDSSDLVLSCTPPQHFMWTCKQLGLVFKEEENRSSESEFVRIDS